MEESPLVPSLTPAGLPVHEAVGTLYRIFHPTDLSPASEVAFAHALKLALVARGELRIMHVDPDVPQTDWSGLPRVRDTLARWGVLPPGSSQADVVRLGLHIEKILAYHEDPTRSLEQHLHRHPADLLVLATHQPDVMDRLLSNSVAEPLARHAGIPTLFIPDGTAGFVHLEDGHVQLSHIVIPIAPIPSPLGAIATATRLIETLQASPVTWTLLYVGKEEDVPAVEAIDRPGWNRRTTVRTGDVIDAIISESETADLLVMPTQGPQGVFEALIGSTMERVLRQIRCPLLGIPVHEAPSGA